MADLCQPMLEQSDYILLRYDAADKDRRQRATSWLRLYFLDDQRVIEHSFLCYPPLPVQRGTGRQMRGWGNAFVSRRLRPGIEARESFYPLSCVLMVFMGAARQIRDPAAQHFGAETIDQAVVDAMSLGAKTALGLTTPGGRRQRTGGHVAACRILQAEGGGVGVTKERGLRLQKQRLECRARIRLFPCFQHLARQRAPQDASGNIGGARPELIARTALTEDKRRQGLDRHLEDRHSRATSSRWRVTSPSIQASACVAAQPKPRELPPPQLCSRFRPASSRCRWASSSTWPVIASWLANSRPSSGGAVSTRKRRFSWAARRWRLRLTIVRKLSRGRSDGTATRSWKRRRLAYAGDPKTAHSRQRRFPSASTGK